jgi:mannose-6-phosphate isomerase-like protein (cupin superfamily)
LQNLESGSFSESEISPALASKLIEEKILVQLSPSIKSDLLFWGYYFTEEELSKKLNKLGLTEKENMQIVDLWGKTTRAGYDTTGLALEDKGVVFYSWHKKCNIWTQHMTEWLVNSQSYPGQGEPFTTGISKVQASKDYKKPIPFKEIRPGEALHRHPDREDRNQTEVYCVTSGEAALLTIEKGKPVINKLKAGDMAVIQPGVTHCVIAVKGRYEHTVFQIPSAFQYGFMLKETVDYKDFDTTEEEITKIALNKLA